MKKRVYWVDVMKYICIMFVMYSHTDFDTNVMKGFYYNFYLFGFFFASGYVYKHKEGFKDFLIKKSRGLLIPWLLFGLANILIDQVASFDAKSSLSEDIKHMFLQVRGLDDKMWFLSALFVAFIPFYFFIRKYEQSEKKNADKYKLIGISFALYLISNAYSYYMNPDLLPWKATGLPWHIEYMFVAMFFMVLGYLFKDWEVNYDSIRSAVKIGVIVFNIGLICAAIVIGGVHENGITDIIYSLVAELSAIFGLVYICKLIKPNKYISYIGENTLICFGVHGKCFSVMQQIIKKISPSFYSNITSSTIYSILFGLVFVIVLSFVLIIPIYIINRWFPFMLGKPMTNFGKRKQANTK